MNLLSIPLSAQLVPVPMAASHLDSILSIERASFAAPWTREMFERELSNRSSRPMTFLINNEVVGFICFWAVQDEAHLMTVAVHPNYRGQGLGRAIMSHMEQMCLKERLNRIILEVARRNEEARNLYKSFGFSAIGFRKRYYKEINDDAIVMEKWLGSRNETESQSHQIGPEGT